jgi:CheY-like chemotaxis protein
MRPPRILVVDDTPEVRSVLTRVLASEGYEVVEAGDGQTALAACQAANGDFDLLLTDVEMPGMSGIELAEKLTGAYSSLRVLYISGQFEGDAVQAKVIHKGFGFLSKPFRPQALIQAVRQNLTPSKGQGQALPRTTITDKKTA